MVSLKKTQAREYTPVHLMDEDVTIKKPGAISEIETTSPMSSAIQKVPTVSLKKEEAANDDQKDKPGKKYKINIKGLLEAISLASLVVLMSGVAGIILALLMVLIRDSLL